MKQAEDQAAMKRMMEGRVDEERVEEQGERVVVYNGGTPP